MSDALRTLALLVAALPAAAAPPEACAPCARGCELVMGHGAGRGLDLAAVLDLNMRGWKPQSSRGIVILGWSAATVAPGRCRVWYAYREGSEVVVPWEVDLAARTLTPLSPLAERVQRMTELLSSATATTAAAAGGDAEQPNATTPKASEP